MVNVRLESNLLVFLSGPMGSGKSTVAKSLAEKLGVPAYDLDHHITEQEQTSVQDIFRERGEAAYRKIEREAILKLAQSTKSGVFALGGGTVVDPQTRRFLIRSGIV